jgi:glycogen synthase
VNIALISQEYPPETAKGGIGTQTYLKAHGLARRGHGVVVISRSTDSERHESRDGAVDVVRLPPAPMAVYTDPADWVAHSHTVAVELARQCSSRGLDLVDFPEWGAEGYLHLVNQTEWNQLASVVHLHGPLVMLADTLGWPNPDSLFYRIGSHMEQTCLQLADGIFSSSDCSADWCARRYGVERDKIPRLHSGIDTLHFSPRDIPKAQRPTIVFVGKIVRNKGVELLLEAACRLRAEFPELRLRMLGGGEQETTEGLQNRASQHGAEGLLELPGYIDHQALPTELSQAHVFAAPSQYEGGPGFVYLEAMACGLPVIACRGSGAAETVTEGESGLLVPPNDMESLTDALRTLLCDPRRRKAMGEQARRFVLQEADTEHCIERIAEFYQQVIANVHNDRRCR